MPACQQLLFSHDSGARMRNAFFAGCRAVLSVCLAASVAFASTPARVRADRIDPAQRLVDAYPDARMTLEEDAGGRYIRIGEYRLLFSPAAGCPAATPDQIGDAPLCALFSQPYPAGGSGRHPAPGFDPGRIRNETLLKLLYGGNSGAVKSETAIVELGGERLLLNRRHGAAAAMARVAVRLERLMRDDPRTRDYILPVAGSWFWRKIKGSEKLSPHSFGIAVDLNAKKGLYWQWARPGMEAAVERLRRDYPRSIVDAFEAEGFIWGGKWNSFDFMHFEYRPELLLPKNRPGLP